MKVAILTRRAETQKKLSEALTDSGAKEIDVLSGSLAHFAVNGLGSDPDLLIVESADGAAELDVLERITAHKPGLSVFMLTEQYSPDYLLRAMRIGVREVLSGAFDEKALRDAIDRLRQRASLTKAQNGKVLAFLPCKGGSGATFLATNLGYALAKAGKSVALIDLNLQFGDASLYVTEEAPATTVSDVAREIRRLDSDLLASSMIKVLPNFGILAAPESPDKAVGIRPESIERIMNIARGCYDYVIIDVGRLLDPVSIRALDNTDRIYLVLQLTLPFVRDAKRLIGVFESLGYPHNKVSLIVNRYQKGGEISLDDVEKTLGAKVVKTVPNSFSAVATSINQGTSILQLFPRDKVSKTLQEMADEMAEQSPKATWFQRVFLQPA